MHVNYLYWLMNSVDPNMQESISVLTNLKSLEQGLVDWKSLEEPQGKRWGQKVSSYVQWMNLETRWCHNGGTIAPAQSLPGGGQGSEGQALLSLPSHSSAQQSPQSTCSTASSPTRMTEALLSKSSLCKLPFVDVKKKKINNRIIGGGLLMTVNHKIL